MLRIGYVRLRDARSAEDTAALKAMGCHVVRAEEPPEPGGCDQAILDSILDFIARGDQLVVTRLEHLGQSTHGVLSVIDRLEARGACLYVMDPDLDTRGEGGKALRAALNAVAAVEPGGRRRRGAPAPEEIFELRAAGVGPVEIARRLGVSRMTVWRKLRTLEA